MCLLIHGFMFSTLSIDDVGRFICVYLMRSRNISYILLVGMWIGNVFSFPTGQLHGMFWHEIDFDTLVIVVYSLRPKKNPILGLNLDMIQVQT